MRHPPRALASIRLRSEVDQRQRRRVQRDDAHQMVIVDHDRRQGVGAAQIPIRPAGLRTVEIQVLDDTFLFFQKGPDGVEFFPRRHGQARQKLGVARRLVLLRERDLGARRLFGLIRGRGPRTR